LQIFFSASRRDQHRFRCQNFLLKRLGDDGGQANGGASTSTTALMVTV